MSAATSVRSALKPASCQHCTLRAFSSAITRHQVRPESPRYIEVPEPPQQRSVPKPVVKGLLPIPRDLFPGKLDTETSLYNSLYRTARVRRTRNADAEPGSRAEWQNQLTAQRRRNLLEGSIELRMRKDQAVQRRIAKAKHNVKVREAALRQAVRDDERLTTQSNNFDLDKLNISGTQNPPNAHQLAHEAKARHDQIDHARYEQKSDRLHDLYNKARSFIVNKEQLDEAIEKAFGTDENPALFTTDFGDNSSPYSVWAYGKPERLQDRVTAMRRRSTMRLDPGSNGAPSAEMQQARVTQIAEQLTGGSFGKNLLAGDDNSR